MAVIPVMDRLNGVIVHAHGGDRQTYPPIQTPLCASTHPIEVGKALLQATFAPHLYVADLDAILGLPFAYIDYPLWRDELGCLWIDAGIRHAESIVKIAECGHDPIIALETLEDWQQLRDWRDAFPLVRMIFSLDLRNGNPIGIGEGQSPIQIAAKALEYGYRRMLVLDISKVGQSKGPSTVELCRQIRRLDARLHLISGGGIRSWEDVQRLTDVGVDDVVVGTAIHEGKLFS
ncbi:HisA/HisF-related TIM barrel protein [Tuwongella immobilis]|uniref:HisA/hisF family protein n=1 Tax=Tuwongella immobilis TaxID=692036 RepID=A0A6C2YNW0_9BACT|nr:HisA/HisF-related TIM barrel protein [Tuwongella immobilis]VIP03310.1 histidine biosynthesis protein : HisA/HisF family protein, putative OS=Planctomyces maris DSM 8797 GN=PM8797T_05275 PE=3 SV=1: His_biosynth [Tuwongella immobilis]VTS03991.1 histidine biosynthesis protein : HisA/HisF family protein, putative OS=Planctomyces maris DSM 8797 GN=PM8797T_05275 PE=3 SV=1: His_biosynth [Tuwongella immobilis]